MNSILQQQCEVLAGARYPLHMPGHKRRVPPAPGLGCYAFDLTEIEGADDLHDAGGILADAMGRTAALYGSARCWYLVGAPPWVCWPVSAPPPPSAARSLWPATATRPSTMAVELGRLTAHYLTPPVVPDFGVYGSVPPAAVAAALDAHPPPPGASF